MTMDIRCNLMDGIDKQLICHCLLEYAQVTKMLGNGRLEAYCFDGMNRLCHIRGKLRKKVHSLCHVSLCVHYFVLGMDQPR